MYVDRPICLELHVQETVRIDRLQHRAADEYVAAQYGALLTPGVTKLQLDKGRYHFRTLEDAQLRVISGGVQVASMSGDPDDDDNPNTEGRGPCSRVPALRVVDNTAGAL
jgi:hypothetical protein